MGLGAGLAPAHERRLRAAWLRLALAGLAHPWLGGGQLSPAGRGQLSRGVKPKAAVDIVGEIGRCVGAPRLAHADRRRRACVGRAAGEAAAELAAREAVLPLHTAQGQATLPGYVPRGRPRLGGPGVNADL